MALKSLNTVGGLSVGWQASNVILSNADVNPNNLTVTATATLGNISNVRIFGGSEGQVLRTDGAGNLSWVSDAAGTPGGSNTQIQFNDDGAFNGVSNFTYNKNTNLLNVNGNVVVGDNTNNVSLFSSGAISSTGNLTVANINTGGVLSVTGNANVGNIGATNGVFTNISGTLTTASQPNITEIGILTSLSVSGNTNVGNLGANNGVFTNVSGNGAALTNLPAGNIVGQVANALVAGTVYTAAQPNITSVGTLTSLTIDGNLIVGNNLFVNGNVTYLNVETVAIEDPIIQLQTGPNGAALTSNTGKDVGTALNYYDTVAKTAFMGWDISNVEIAFGADVAIANEVVTFTQLANTRSGNTLTTGVFATTLSATGNANVGNIGTAGIITATGNVTGGNLLTAGRLGVGTTNITDGVVRVTGAISGATTSSGVSVSSEVQSGVTAAARYFQTSVSTQASNFTLPLLTHYLAVQGTIGATSNVTTQQGFMVDSTLTGATNNYGFRGAIPAGTNRWNLYMDGTAPNYLNGQLVLGTTTTAGAMVNNTLNLTGATSVNSYAASGTVQSDVTVSARGYGTFIGTQAASFTLSELLHFRAAQGTFGLNSTVTLQTGFNVESTLTGATNNYGFRGQLAVNSGRFNLYMDGTADNYLNGRLLMGTTSARANFNNATGSPVLQVEGTSFNATSISAVRNSADTSPPTLVFGKTRGATVGSTTIVGAADELGRITFQGSDGTEFVEAASIRGEMDGTPGANDMPGRLIFSTTPDNSTTITERMRINSSGNVGIGTTSPTSLLHVVGTANITGNTDIANLNLVKFQETVVTANATGTITPNLATGSIFNYTLTGNITLNSLANAVSGSSATILLKQDATGGRTLTSTMLFSGNVRTLSTTANAQDILSVTLIGSTYYAALTKGYA
jgi:hypothetical protein